MSQKIWTIMGFPCFLSVGLMHCLCTMKRWRIHVSLYKTLFLLFCPDCYFLKSDWIGTLDFIFFGGENHLGHRDIQKSHISSSMKPLQWSQKDLIFRCSISLLASLYFAPRFCLPGAAAGDPGRISPKISN